MIYGLTKGVLVAATLFTLSLWSLVYEEVGGARRPRTAREAKDQNGSGEPCQRFLFESNLLVSEANSLLHE